MCSQVQLNNAQNLCMWFGVCAREDKKRRRNLYFCQQFVFGWWFTGLNLGVLETSSAKPDHTVVIFSMPINNETNNNNNVKRNIELITHRRRVLYEKFIIASISQYVGHEFEVFWGIDRRDYEDFSQWLKELHRTTSMVPQFLLYLILGLFPPISAYPFADIISSA